MLLGWIWESTNLLCVDYTNAIIHENYKILGNNHMNTLPSQGEVPKTCLSSEIDDVLHVSSLLLFY